jgi:hypothetical protein
LIDCSRSLLARDFFWRAGGRHDREPGIGAWNRLRQGYGAFSPDDSESGVFVVVDWQSVKPIAPRVGVGKHVLLADAGRDNAGASAIGQRVL